MSAACFIFRKCETDLCLIYLLFLIGLVKKVTGGYKITFHPEGPDGPAWEADFSRPFKRFDMMTDLEREIGISLPKPDQLDTEGYFNARFDFESSLMPKSASLRVTCMVICNT